MRVWSEHALRMKAYGWVLMTDDFEDPPNDIPDEAPAGPPTAHPDDEFPDDDAIDGTEEDATTTPEDPQT